MKDPENKQRISIYVDRELVKKADELLSLAKCSSRNEFVAKAIERYIGELALGGGNSFVTLSCHLFSALSSCAFSTLCLPQASGNRKTTDYSF